MASFKEIYEPKNNENKPEKSAVNAAAVLLSSHATKDKKTTIRINSQTFAQFAEINRKLGSSCSSVINTLIFKYIQEHKDLLDSEL